MSDVSRREFLESSASAATAATAAAALPALPADLDAATQAAVVRT